jgi:ribose/xylose/arabinose/galactoside ABC-type transport system permease subunit
MPLIIIALIVVATIVEPRFFSTSNFQNISRQMAILAIVAVGQSFAIISGGFDLSVGSVLGLSGVVCAMTLQDHGLAVAILAGLGAGAAAGLVNGLVIAKLNVSPFVVTLGMYSAALGVALMLTDGIPIYFDELPHSFQVIGAGWVGPIPVPSLIALGALIVGGLILHRTVFGQYVFAIGGNEEAARLAGIRVQLIKVLVYVVVGLFVGSAAIVFTSRVEAGQPNAGAGFELESIAAVIIGGVHLGGGVGTIVNVFLGVLLLSLLSNALDLMNVSSYTQLVVQGAVIVAAVALDRFRYRGV